MLFKGKSGNLLGVDVGSASVKLLELSVRGDSHRVEFYGMAPLPPNAVVAKHISDVQAVGAAIRRLLPRASKNRRCAAAIPVASASVSTFEVDAAFADEEVDAHIVADVERHLPCPLDEAAYDFEVQGLSESNPGQAEVLLAACRKEHLARLRAALVAGSLRPVVVETHAFALARAVARMRRSAGAEQDAFGVLDVGAAAVRLLLFDRGSCGFQEFEQPFDRASPPGGGAEPRELRQLLAGPAAQALTSLRAPRGRNAPNVLYVAGGGAAACLNEGFGAEISLPTALADPFQGMAVAPSVDQQALKRDAPALMVACGLALRDFP